MRKPLRLAGKSRWALAMAVVACGLAAVSPVARAAPDAEAVAREPGKIPSPFFNDPNYECAADPEIVWNAKAQEWWVFYTARRIMADDNPGCGGCPIGVAASKDLIDWRFVGYCTLDGVVVGKDAPYTAWAPGIITDDAGVVHMYLTFKQGAKGEWGEGGSTIRHYVAKDGDLLNGWTKVNDLTPFNQSIDAGLFIDQGKWTMLYRDLPPEGSPPGSLYWATSANGTDWDLHGQVPGDPNDQKVMGAGYQEAPYLFRWKGTNWMLADQGGRLGQYRSDDLKTWRFQGPLLQNPGWRPLSRNSGKHPSVAIIQDRAFIFYFNHPYKAADDSPLERKKAGRSWLHVSELTVTPKGVLACDRDALVTPPSEVTPSTVNAGR